MSHPAFQAGSFAHLKLGRKPPKPSPKLLRFENYIDAAKLLPAVPAAIDYTAKVTSWPMYGNDVYGDCTVAAAGHLIQAWSFNAGTGITPTSAEILKTYWATGDGTDDGRIETDVLDYWRHTGVGTDKITAYVAVDPSNIPFVKAAIYLFGGVYTGISLPVTAQNQTTWSVVGDGKSGDSAAGSWGGHAVPYEAFDTSGVTLVTWGGTLKATWGFHTDYTDEVYAIISPDWMNAQGASPAGFDLAALTADLATLGGHDPTPPPAPPPTPASLAAVALTHLKETRVSYPVYETRLKAKQYVPVDGSGTHWGKALAALAEIEAS